MNLDGKITNPGELRTRIQLAPPAITTMPGGAKKATYDWNAAVSVLCKWVNAHGQQVVSNEAFETHAPVTILIRYLAGLDAKWAVRKGSDIYQIVAPPDDIRDRHEYMELKLQIVKGSA